MATTSRSERSVDSRPSLSRCRGATLSTVRLAISLVLLIACNARLPAVASDDPGFGSPAQLTILGYSGDAMEPFLTREGSILIFNNSNEVPTETDLHWAERVDDVTFVYRGKIQGINSPALDAVASVDRDGNIYFVTTRSYDQTLTTIYRGRFERGVVTDVAPVSGISRGIPGQVNFDVEVSLDGSELYFVDGTFKPACLRTSSSSSSPASSTVSQPSTAAPVRTAPRPGALHADSPPSPDSRKLRRSLQEDASSTTTRGEMGVSSSNGSSARFHRCRSGER